MGIEIKGTSETAAYLKKKAKESVKALSKALRAGAKIVRDAARKNVHSQSGLLAKNLKIKTKTRKGKVKCTVGFTKDDVDYMSFVEFGTRKMAAQHMLEKAAKDCESQVKNIIRETISELTK